MRFAEKTRVLSHAILTPVRCHSTLFLFLLLASSLVIPTLCYSTGAFPKPFLWVPPLSCCYIVTLLAYILRRVHLHLLVWLLSYALLSGEIFSLLIYQSPYSMTVLQLIMETNQREASEFLLGNGVALQLLAAHGITLLTLAIARLAAIQARKLSGSLRTGFSCLFIILLVLLSGNGFYSYYRIVRAYQAEVTTSITENKRMPLRNSPFIRFLYAHALNVVSQRELTKLVRTVQATQVDSCTHQSPIILLLLGESFNKYHTPLYNPSARPTTPGFTRFRESGNLITYDDAVSPYNVTSKTLRYMFSTYYPGCGRDWVDCTLFPAVFRKAGYQVHFLTNQFAGEENNRDHHGHAGGTIFNHPQLRQLQFTHMNTQAETYDMDLLRQLPHPDTLAAHPSLLIFHTLGMHEDYAQRFPASYAHFTAADITNPYTDASGRQIIADYDNAMLYNDSVLTALLNHYREQDVVAIFLSDHGEEVYDWRNSCYRTNSDQMTPEIARYQYEIPFMFYVSDTFRQRHPELLSQIQQARHRPFISTLLPFALFHLAGISHPDYKAELDILSPQYAPESSRIIRDDVDYDQLCGSLR